MKSIFAGNLGIIMDLNWSNKKHKMMKTLAFNCPSTTKSLQSKLVWRQYFNEGLTVIIKHYCCRRECVFVCGTVRAHFTTTTYFMRSDQWKHPHVPPHLCQVSVLSSVRSQLSFFSHLFVSWSRDVVSSEGGDAESFIPTWKTETGGVYRDRRADAWKTFSLRLR